MGELRKRTVGPGAKDARTALLLDLTAVDLRTLRASDDPELLTAVDRVLEETSGPKEIWYVGSEGGRRTFPAELAGGADAEDAPG
ncbi:hypothetical protein OG885_15400 [Streptomyces sp. NBC_00028]|uniref:hypothetical protein n=1 Tax=Streptomyces sp. NBC_00028 TaxID=2975624 RepID=UPI003252E6CF